MKSCRTLSCQFKLSVFSVGLVVIIVMLKDLPVVMSIQCLNCDAVHLNIECNGTENIRQCPITYDTCQTIYRYSSEVGKLQISKRCSKQLACETQREVLAFYAPCNSNLSEWACAECCQTDLCNTNAGSQDGRLASFCRLTTLEAGAFVVLYVHLANIGTGWR